MAVLGKKWQDGEVICRQGDAEDCMYAIQSGCVEAVHDGDGTSAVVGELTAGEFFGEMALFNRQQHAVTMRAKGETRVLALDREAFIRRVHEDPSFAFRLLERLGQHIRTLVTEVSLFRRSRRDVKATTVDIRAKTLVEMSLAGWDMTADDDTRVTLGFDRRSDRRPRELALGFVLGAAAALALVAILALWRGWF